MKRINPVILIKKVLIDREKQSYLYPLAQGNFFWAFSKATLTIYTWYEMVRDANQGYKQTKDFDYAREIFLHQLIKWFLGLIIGTMCFDYGFTLHPKKGMLSGFLAAILGNSICDYFWNKDYPKLTTPAAAASLAAPSTIRNLRFTHPTGILLPTTTLRNIGLSRYQLPTNFFANTFLQGRNYAKINRPYIHDPVPPFQSEKRVQK